MDSKRSNVGNISKIEQVDRISDLPDSILAHIFSFLPTKDAVAASILARKYRYFWAQVPVIDVGEHEYFPPSAFEQRIRFQNFVNNVLLINKECLRFCRLTIPSKIDSLYANAWIEAIAMRKVKEMHLNVEVSAKLPSCVFEELVALKLELFPNLNMTSLQFPSLRILELIRIISLNVGSLLSLLTSSCPILEELVLDRCELSGSEDNLHVCSSSLKKLQIIEMGGIFVNHVMVIDAPNLEYLMILEDVSTTMYYARDLSSLREADLFLPILCYSPSHPGVRTSSLQFINSLTSSSTLQLRRTMIQDIQDPIYRQLPAFNNLTCLELELYKSCRCILPAILERAPNLVNLIVECGPVDVDRKCSHVAQVPSCLLLNMKSIKIIDLNDSEEDMEMVSYLLMNARVLKEMKFHWFDKLSPMEETEILGKLMSFNRGSSTSTISIC